MKDLLFILGIIGIFIVSVSSSHDSAPIVEGEESRGIIYADIEFGDCFTEAGLNGKNWVIETEKEYAQLALYQKRNSSCEGSELPDINFKKYSLLGQITDQNCKSYVTREVTKNQLTKSYSYDITVLQAGPCDRMNTVRNWVLVPKLPKRYMVEFDVKYIEDLNP